MTGVMRRFSAALAAAAMAVSIVPFADISAYAEYAATRTAIISPISQRVR